MSIPMINRWRIRLDRGAIERVPHALGLAFPFMGIAAPMLLVLFSCLATDDSALRAHIIVQGSKAIICGLVISLAFVLTYVIRLDAHCDVASEPRKPWRAGRLAEQVAQSLRSTRSLRPVSMGAASRADIISGMARSASIPTVTGLA